MYYRTTPVALAHLRIAMLVSSVPLAETQVLGLAFRRAITAFNSSATRAPDREVPATSPRHSRVKALTIARMRNRPDEV
jgi:hypothetical protein